MNPYYVIRNLLFQTKHIYAGPTRLVSAVVTLNEYKKLTTSQTPILFYLPDAISGTSSVAESGASVTDRCVTFCAESLARRSRYRACLSPASGD